MTSVSENVGTQMSDALRAILFAGLTAGVLDITGASVSGWIRGGRTPIWIFQSVAGGLYGAETFNGGYRTAALGLAIHFFIALTAATVFYLASRKLRFMIDQPVISGVLYGIAVYIFMYFGVLPLTPLQMSYPLLSVVIAVTIHIFCVGLPIALVVRKFSK
jgi:hypothetical protein